MSRIIPRGAWNPATPTDRLEPVRWPVHPRVTVHHTAGAAPAPHASLRQDLAAVRGIDRYHRWANGWRGGIGYSYVILPSGRVVEGRGEHVAAHAPGYNHLPGIALVGNFEDRAPSLAAQDALAWLIAYLGDGKSAIQPHRRVYATACPGARLVALLPTVARAAKGKAKAPGLGEEARYLDLATLPGGGTLRLAVPASDAYRTHRERAGRPWAGWAECRGPLEWIAKNGLQDPESAVSWQGHTWRGARDVTNVARNLVARFLAA